MRISLTDRVKISDQVLSQEVSGEAVLLDLSSEKYFGLDPVGTRMWQLLREHGDLQKTFEIMLEEFDVGEGQLCEDLIKLIGELEEAGLVALLESKQ